MIGNCIRCEKAISDVYLVCTECAEAQFEKNIFWIAASSVIGNPVIDRYREDSEPTLTIGERPGDELEYLPGKSIMEEIEQLPNEHDPAKRIYKMNRTMAELGIPADIKFNSYIFSPKDVELFFDIFSYFEGMEPPSEGFPELERAYLRLANLFHYTSECADISAFDPGFRKTVVKDLREQAEKYYKEAADISEDPAPSRNLGRLYLKDENYSAAEENFRKAISLDQEDIDAHIGLAEVFIETGKHKKADEIIDSLILKDKNNPLIWYLKAERTRMEGRWGGAVQLFEQAYNKDRNFTEALVMKGRVLIDEGMLEEADRFYDQVIEKDEFNASAWYWKSKALYMMEKWGGALQCIHEALSIDSQMVDGWKLKGDILFEREVYEEALVAYNNALEIEPDSESIALKKGACEKNLE